MAGILIYLLFLLLQKPNVVGSITNIGGGHAAVPGGAGQTGSLYGAGKIGAQNFSVKADGIAGALTTVSIDANLSNAIYINSGKIYPSSLVLNYIIKY